MTVPAINAITIDGFVLDASLSETHGFDSDITDYPVEQGADVTDNVRPKPITVEIEGIVSESPVTNDPAPGSNPPQDALAKLLAVRDAREPVTIGTALKRYDNMALESLSIPIDKDTGRALRFTASFKQIILVTNQRTTVRTAKPSGQTQSGLGNKSGFAKAVAYAIVFSIGPLETLIASAKTPPSGAVFVQTDKVDGQTFNRYQWFKGGPRADGIVTSGQYQAYFTVVKATYDKSTGQWTSASGKPLASDDGGMAQTLKSIAAGSP